MPISKQDVVQTVGQFCPSLFKRTLNYCWGKTKISSSCLKWASNARQDGLVPVLSRLVPSCTPNAANGTNMQRPPSPSFQTKANMPQRRDIHPQVNKGRFTLKWTLQALQRTIHSQVNFASTAKDSYCFTSFQCLHTTFKVNNI